VLGLGRNQNKRGCNEEEKPPLGPNQSHARGMGGAPQKGGANFTMPPFKRLILVQLGSGPGQQRTKNQQGRVVLDLNGTLNGDNQSSRESWTNAINFGGQK